jgi:hypothetical protein
MSIENIEQARDLFRSLEEGSPGKAADVARRAFCIQDRLAGC